MIACVQEGKINHIIETMEVNDEGLMEVDTLCGKTFEDKRVYFFLEVNCRGCTKLYGETD